MAGLEEVIDELVEQLGVRIAEVAWREFGARAAAAAGDVPLAVSEAQAARMLSVDRKTLGRLVSDGLITRIKVRRLNRYAVAELERFLADEGRAEHLQAAS